MKRRDLEQFGNLLHGPRWLAGFFGLLFAGIGCTVLVFLWSAPFNQFGSPPLFFHIFGSFIALGFVGFGLAGFGTSLGMRHVVNQIVEQSLPQSTDSSADPIAAPAATGYACSQCGAKLDAQADVSPHGDVKCTFCGKWFNIHQRHSSA